MQPISRPLSRAALYDASKVWPASRFSARCICQTSGINLSPSTRNPQTTQWTSRPSPIQSKHVQQTRPFTTTSPLRRKKQKKIAEQEEDPANSIPPEKVVDEAFDFTDLDSGNARAIEKLKDELSKLRPGGRLDPEVIENLRVQLKGSGGGGSNTIRLGDLATVVPKGGRSISVIVAEEEHLKEISSTILSSPHSLVPTPDPHSPLTLNIPIPPPTAESRSLVKDTAKSHLETTLAAIRQSRGECQKRLRGLELDKKTRVPKDEMMKAHKEMEKRNENAGKEAKRLWEERVKILDR